MRGLLRYVCFYCVSRFLYSTIRSVARRPATPTKPCQHHGQGLLLTLVALPFIAVLGLIVLGFVTR